MALSCNMYSNSNKKTGDLPREVRDLLFLCVRAGPVIPSIVCVRTVLPAPVQLAPHYSRSNPVRLAEDPDEIIGIHP